MEVRSVTYRLTSQLPLYIINLWCVKKMSRLVTLDVYSLNMKLARRRSRSISRFLPYAASIVTPGGSLARRVAGAALQYGAKRFYNYMTTGKRSSSGVVTSNQYDVKRQYKYKRMPKYKRRKWKRIVKTSSAVTLSLLGSRTQLRNSQLSQSVPTTNQTVFRMHLYGRAGTDVAGIEAGANDLANLMSTDNQINTNRAWKAHFVSAVMDLTIRSVDNAGMEVDLYEIGYFDTTKAVNFGDMYQIAFDTTENTNGVDANRITWTSRGATLFDIPCLGQAGVKIYKKTKVFLGPGQTTTYQIRDPKHHIFTSEDFRDDEGFVKRGMTRTLIVIAKQLPGAAAAGNLAIGVTRKYMYKLMENKGVVTNTA